MNLYKKLDSLRPKIESEDFHHGKGLANEINFYIFDYDPKDEMEVRVYLKSLQTSINSKHDDIRVVEFDLYQLMLQVLDEKNYLPQIGEMEEEVGSESLIEPIQSSLRLALNDDIIIDFIIQNISPETDVVFLTGVGKVWPIIRAHKVLNILHIKLDKTPLILFYPGSYANESLNLFNEINDGNYYRAFKWITEGV